ncbi:MAG: penicillin-binding transpeptidase domain-containing protein, partial [Oscillospiraceae bacterium]|nr:penicillin-binding transpeptidase domain-containing protein [Oscillospiraceae bacterium]
VTRRIYTWFEEAIIRDIVRDLGEQRGISPQLATRYLYTSGLRIMSTIDLNMQAIVDEVFQNPENLPTVTGSTQPLQSGIVIADPHTGAIRALSGGTGTKSSNMLFNRATMARRPPGSALKPVSVFAPAIEMGHITPNTRYNDTYNTELRGTNWFPRNADRTHRGIVDVRTALRLSLNTVPAIILDEITPTAGFNFMRDALGFELSPADEDYAPLAAGQLTNGATVREMASAFTTFPNGGERMELRTYSRIYRRNGEIFLDNPPRGVQAMSENNANMMTSMLIDAVTNGTGGLANIGGGMPTAGKTGTSTDSMDRWFVGFTPHYVAAVWTGFDRPTRMRSEGNPAARIFRSVMAPIHADLPSAQFTQPTIVDRPSTMGVQAASYTVTLLDVMGNTIMVHNHTGTLGSTVTVNAPHLDNYLIVGESSATITLSTDPNRNNIVFIYSWIGEQAEDPTDPDAPIDDDIFTFPPPDTTPGTPDIPPGTPGAPDIPPGTPGTPGYIPGQPPANVPPSDGDPPPQDDIFFFMPPPPEPPPPEREPHDTPDE